MTRYLILNTERIPAGKGLKTGTKTLFITIDGKPACLPWKLGTGFAIRIPHLLAKTLWRLRIVNFENTKRTTVAETVEIMGDGHGAYEKFLAGAEKA
jgi:hypothetical protein